MKAAGFGCYRKDATGASLESALAAAGLKGDFIVTDGPGPTQQAAKVAALTKVSPGSSGQPSSGLTRTAESGLGFRGLWRRATQGDAHRRHRPAEPDRS